MEKNNHRTVQLLEELEEMRRQVAGLKAKELICRQAEGKLRTEMARADKCVDIAGVAILVIRSDETVAFINQKGCNILGCGSDEIIGKNWFDAFVPVSDRDRARACFSKLMAGDVECVEYFENPVLRKNGEQRIIEWRNAVLRDEDGGIIAALSSGADITDSRRMEDELRESEKRLYGIIDFLPDATFAIDLDGKIISWNRAMEEMTGVPAQQMVGKGNYEYALPFYGIRRPVLIDLAFRFEQEDIPQKYFYVKKEGNVLLAEVDAPLKGENRSLWGKASLLYDSRGNIAGAIESIRDISDRRRAEDELKKHQDLLEERVKERTVDLAKINARLLVELEERGRAEKEIKDRERRFRELADLLPQTVFECDAGGHLTFVNKRCFDVFGYTAQDFDAGLTIFQMVGPEHRIKIQESMEKVLAGEEIRGLELSALRKDKSVFPMLMYSNPIMTQDRSIGFRGVAVDISNRKRMEMELRKSEQRYRMTIDSMKDAIHVVDKDLRIILANKALIEWTRRIGGRIDVEGLKLFEAFSFLPQKVRQEYEQVLSTGQMLITEERTVLDGRDIYTETRKIPVMEGEKVVHVVTAVRDITERKRMEEELLTAQKLESVGILAGGIAHDFNNLLAGIQGYIDLARMHSQPGQSAYENLERAEKSCIQASELTKRLITFSKGGEPLRKTAPLSEMLHQPIESALRGSNVECKQSLPEDLWPVLADESHIRQVVYHLSVNAREAMPEGGEICISAENIMVTENDGLFLPEGAYVKWTVADRGVGIAREDLPKIFDPYFTTKDLKCTKGMGLGLAICYSIIKKHEGLISVASEPGAGSAFTVYLPADVNRNASIEAVSKAIRAPRGKILIMDDEAVIRDMLSKMLDELGYDAAVAQDGEEAVELFQSAEKQDQPFAMVVLDLTVRGGMGGEFALRKMLHVNPHVKAIIISGYTDDPIVTNFRKYGFMGAIAKPFTMDQLKNALDEVLSMPDGR